jgi:hypothetical protein
MRNYFLGALRVHSFGFLVLVLGALCVASVVMADIISGIPTTAISAHVTITQLTINKPTVSVGDTMIASIAVNDGTIVNVTAPSGWTQIARTDNDINVALISYWKVAGASEPSTYTWSIDEQTKAVGGITPYSGVDAVNPIDTAAGSSGFGTLATTSAVTTTAANEEIIAFFATDVNKSFSTPTGMTQKYNLAHTSAGPSMAADDVIQAVAGSAGSKSSTITGNKQRNWVAQQIALRKVPEVPVVNGSASAGAINDIPPLVTNITFPHTVNPGNNQILIVTMGAEGSGEDTSATYYGIPMTKGNPHGAGDSEYYDYWYLLNPPTGTHDVVVNFPSAAGRHYGAVTISNVDQTTPFDTVVHVSGGDFSSASNVRATTDVTTTGANELILYFVDFGGDNNTYVPDDPQIYSAVGGYANTGAVRAQPSAGVATVGGTISRSYGGSVWEIIAVPIRPAN